MSSDHWTQGCKWGSQSGGSDRRASHNTTTRRSQPIDGQVSVYGRYWSRIRAGTVSGPSRASRTGANEAWPIPKAALGRQQAASQAEVLCGCLLSDICDAVSRCSQLREHNNDPGEHRSARAPSTPVTAGHDERFQWMQLGAVSNVHYSESQLVYRALSPVHFFVAVTGAQQHVTPDEHG